MNLLSQSWMKLILWQQQHHQAAGLLLLTVGGARSLGGKIELVFLDIPTATGSSLTLTSGALYLSINFELDH